MTDTQTISPTPMDEITVRLGDLGLAPENLRFHEPADDGVPQLAETVLAAGVLIPPIVRAGRKGEQAFMALDGRRRRFSRNLASGNQEIECVGQRHELDRGRQLDRADFRPIQSPDHFRAEAAKRATMGMQKPL